MDLTGLSPEEKETCQRIAKEIAETGRSPLLEQIWAMDYERQPVPIHQFIEDEYYIGQHVRHLSEAVPPQTELDFSGFDSV